MSEITARLDHMRPITGTRAESWANRDSDFVIFFHPDTEFCDSTQCPRMYRDLPHFAVYFTEHSGGRYAFEFRTALNAALKLLKG